MVTGEAGSGLEARDAVVVAVESARLDVRVGLAVQAGEHAPDEPAIDRTDHVRVQLGGLAERATYRDDREPAALVFDVGREDVCSESLIHISEPTRPY